MPETFQVGPLLVDSRILIYILSIMVGLFSMNYILKRTRYKSKALLDLMLSNVLIVVLIWKFGAILFTPSLIWTKPFQILMLAGSWKELLLGIAAALIYTWYRLKRMEISFIFFLDILSYGVVSAVICKSLLKWEYGVSTNAPWGISLTDPSYQYHPVNVYMLLLSTALLIWLWRYSSTLGQGRIVQEFLMFYGIGLFVISYFKISEIYLLYFSLEQLAYVGMIVLGRGIQYIIRRK